MSEHTSRPAPPLPTPFDWDAGYWRAASDGRLVVQCCASCRVVRNFPCLMCPHCGALEAEWLPASGRGRIYSWSTLHKAFHRAFSELPLTIAIVELDDFPAVHLVTHIDMDGRSEEDLAIDLPVAVYFSRAANDVALPCFRVTSWDRPSPAATRSPQQDEEASRR